MGAWESRVGRFKQVGFDLQGPRESELASKGASEEDLLFLSHGLIL